MIYTLGLGLYGINRSLWLDEAWVANSIRTPDIRGMFIYSEWLQTSPPLFLVLERAAVDLLGLSSVSLRVVPLALAMLAAGAMWAAARRVLSWPVAVLASALLVTNPTVIEYSRTVKQYSGEVAASAVLLWVAAAYFENPSRKQYGWLLSTTAIAPLLAYSSVFLLPGLVLAEGLAGRRNRAALLGAVSAVELGALWVLLIRPNYSPELRAFWAADADGGLTPVLFAAVLLCAAAAAWIIWRARRDGFLWVCALPCLLLAASAAARWYPANPRTRLFALPCFLLLLFAGVARALVPAVSRLVSTPACITAALLCTFALWKQISEHRAEPQEDYASAVSYLRSHATATDLLLIHAAASEGFRLYAAIENWEPAVQYGNTGWPCCARGRDARPGTSSREAVLADLDAKIPAGFRGRIWLLYPTRPTHGSYVGLNEGEVWRNHVWDRGCPPGPYVALANLAISPMNCGP